MQEPFGFLQRTTWFILEIPNSLSLRVCSMHAFALAPRSRLKIIGGKAVAPDSWNTSRLASDMFTKGMLGTCKGRRQSGAHVRDSGSEKRRAAEVGATQQIASQAWNSAPYPYPWEQDSTMNGFLPLKGPKCLAREIGIYAALNRSLRPQPPSHNNCSNSKQEYDRSNRDKCVGGSGEAQQR